MAGLADSVPEVFERFGPVAIRRMFGGHGIYHEGLMFALVTGETLYLKSDATTRPSFESRGLPAFEFKRQGRLMTTSYRQAPAEVLEDRDAAAEWAKSSFEAALRARKKK